MVCHSAGSIFLLRNEAFNDAGKQEKYVTVRVLIFPGHRDVDSDVALCTLSQVNLLMISKFGLW